MLTEKDWIKKAYVQMNKKFILIRSLSGYRMSGVDFEKNQFFLEHKTDDLILGEYLFEAIENSRFLSCDENEKRRQNHESNTNLWLKNAMKNQGYKTKGDMFKPMLHCSVEKTEKGYLFGPTHQRALTAWEYDDETEANKFTIPLTATAAEMGAALRRCLSLCTSKFDPPKNA